ncbi:glutamine--fructose-6-phosphate transaminase (isomerizing) [Desulfobacterota bacterium AH_259_B03_O07]|nr:glutamine--fructose-6-phosphate transaminase (isomerizing) [Desulfobacterota bacterium AH_259_B03_O07]
MCGIVGYIGKRNAVPILIEGLKRLEYRGYDSSGVAFYNNETDEIVIRKTKGKLSNLETLLRNDNPCESFLGIGHTRWATHGKPTETNAHPHCDCSGKVAVVHNGIIENYNPLKLMLINEGHFFRSETDTEVIAHLIEQHLSNGNLIEAVKTALKVLEGTYALAIISSESPEKIIAARQGSPLIVGQGRKEYLLASDVPAILSHTKDAIFVNDGELVVLYENFVEIMDLNNGNHRPKEIHQIPWDLELTEKGGYAHFMLKEIHEQPQAVKNTYSGNVILDEGKREWEGIGLSAEEMNKISKIYLVACGTSWHASLTGKFMIETLARIAAEVDLSSEFRYRAPFIDDATLTIGVTQSGETADTLGAIRKAKECGSKILAICNVVGSSITREADGVIYTHAGPEIGVASTKAFTSQLIALYMFSLYLGRIRGFISSSHFLEMMDELNAIPEKIKSILLRENEIKELADFFYKRDSFFFLGRGNTYPIALEGALKLKEISYVHAEGYAGGEMKHGPIALVDDQMVVVALITRNSTYEKMLGNIEEVKARDGIIIALATEGDEEIRQNADHVFYIPETNDLLSPILLTVPLQLLAYYIAKNRGCDIDQPRNLAKSVTVE